MRPTTQWELLARFGWIDWSRALRDATLTARDPDRGDPDLVPQAVDGVSPLRLRDQYVLAFGAVYQSDGDTRLRAGYNYGRQPVQESTLTPLLALTPDHHYMLGYGRALSSEWSFDAAVQYQPARDVRYSNPNSPLTAQARERNHVLYLHLIFSRCW